MEYLEEKWGWGMQPSNALDSRCSAKKCMAAVKILNVRYSKED